MGGIRFVMQLAERLQGEHEEVCWQQCVWLSCAGQCVYCTFFYLLAKIRSMDTCFIYKFFYEGVASDTL